LTKHASCIVEESRQASLIHADRALVEKSHRAAIEALQRLPP
jgi:hypothetical protein